MWTRAEIYDARMGGPLPWIVRVARNCAIDRLRARRVRATVDAPAIDVAAVEAAAPATGIQTPEAAVLDAERRRTLTDALAGLPAEQRQLIEAAFFEGYTHSELAQRFGLPLGTVKTRIRAGMIAMRQKAGARRMIPDDIQALALADAIGALDPDERRDLEARLAALPPNVRAEVAHLYDASVEIAASASGEEPSPGVRDALLARVAAPSNHTITSTDGEWVETAVPGVRMKILAIDRARDRVTMLLKGEPGARYPAHRHSGPEECYVISGSLIVEGRVLRAGDFHHAEGDSDHGEAWTDEGVEVLLVASASDYAG